MELVNITAAPLLEQLLLLHLGSCAAPAGLPHALYNLVCMKALDILNFFFLAYFSFCHLLTSACYLK